MEKKKRSVSLQQNKKPYRWISKASPNLIVGKLWTGATRTFLHYQTIKKTSINTQNYRAPIKTNQTHKEAKGKEKKNKQKKQKNESS